MSLIVRTADMMQKCVASLEIARQLKRSQRRLERERRKEKRGYLGANAPIQWQQQKGKKEEKQTTFPNASAPYLD